MSKHNDINIFSCETALLTTEITEWFLLYVTETYNFYLSLMNCELPINFFQVSQCWRHDEDVLHIQICALYLNKYEIWGYSKQKSSLLSKSLLILFLNFTTDLNKITFNKRVNMISENNNFKKYMTTFPSSGQRNLQVWRKGLNSTRHNCFIPFQTLMDTDLAEVGSQMLRRWLHTHTMALEKKL